MSIFSIILNVKLFHFIYIYDETYLHIVTVKFIHFAVSQKHETACFSEKSSGSEPGDEFSDEDCF